MQLKINVRHICKIICANNLVTNKCRLATVAYAMCAEKPTLLLPPPNVRGMTKLDVESFVKQVRIPCLKMANGNNIQAVVKFIKPYLLKMDNLRAIQPTETSSTESSSKMFLLNPNLVSSLDDFPEAIREKLEERQLGKSDFGYRDVKLSYENWKSDDILNAVLPENQEKSASYSRVGHIVHLNLREHLLDYRFLIGQVLLDKLKGVSCVVNKTETIDNTFRKLNMEVVAGDGSNMVATVKENGCTYQLDFSEVFWNPRLCGEHERLVAKIGTSGKPTVLYDVFAGVGPFAIPSARKKQKCRVLANDLNPHSHEWLRRNVELNKVEDRVTVYNLDGRDFIRDVLKPDFLRASSEDVETEFHVVMNLPAMAVEFLDAFRGLLKSETSELKDLVKLTVHCYLFSKEVDYREDAVQKVEENLRTVLDRTKELLEVFHVRNVAPRKEMMRVSFILPRSVMFGLDVCDRKTKCSESSEQEAKRICSENAEHE